jgi:hydroxymethylbilane synthase
MDEAAYAGRRWEADVVEHAKGGRRVIVVGTRQSALALTQTGQVIEQLQELAALHKIDVDFEIRKIVTKGDRILDVTLSKVGGKGLFVKEIEQALLDGEIDIAVHSMKDMPYELPEGLMNGAVPKRVDPRDCLITREGVPLEQLPYGAKVGTSSLRRACQLMAARPDLQLESIRGNIDSRIRKLESEGFDAIVLAAAGLHRMGWEDKISAYLPVEISVPAVGQGALGIECRAGDNGVRTLLDLYNDAETSLAVRAERSFLGALNGGCQIPIGAYATVVQPPTGGGAALLEMTGIVGTPDGKVLLKETLRGSDPEALGKEAAGALKARGADRILAEVGG